VSWLVRVIPNRYADSVRLMSVARDVRAMDGVDACEIGMGTPANLETLAALGAQADSGPADLVIAVQVADGVGEDAVAAAERALASTSANGIAAAGPAPPRSLPAAAREAGDAGVALISVPGEYATLAAHQSLTLGLDVFLFSDHVDVADEVELKRRALQRGRLVMGPGCGTAMLDGTGLGFANVVARGPVGIVAAAGTGAQEAACLVDDAGAGVSQIIGVGGRDLSGEVGGLMFREGMRRLADDDETETLLLVSKPPAQAVVRGLAASIPSDKRVVAAFVGPPVSGAPFDVHPTVEAAALAAAQAAPAPVAELEGAIDARRAASAGRSVLGLFSGGTLAEEAATILAATLGPVARDEDPGGALADRHRVLDLGEERYTEGRPHPMVDLDLRIELLEREADDEALGCVLLDIVLGYGAHRDPAGSLAPALEPLAQTVPVVARVCGTRGDPQDRDAQERVLRDAGVLVAPSNAAAARLAARAVQGAAA
jgi:FdrA protein